MPFIPRILPVAQGAIVDVPHTAEGLIQVHPLIGRRVAAVAIGTVRHLQMIRHHFVKFANQLLNRKAAAFAGGPLFLPGLNAGVSRGEA